MHGHLNVKLVHLVGFRPDPARKLSANLSAHIPLLCVQWKTPDDWTEELSETCRVLFQK